MKLFFILGNQLFPLNYLDKFKKDHLFFLAEDYELCTYEKHHKQKILLFLSSMRSYLDRLRKDKFKTEYLLLISCTQLKPFVSLIHIGSAKLSPKIQISSITQVTQELP